MYYNLISSSNENKIISNNINQLTDPVSQQTTGWETLN